MGLSLCAVLMVICAIGVHGDGKPRKSARAYSSPGSSYNSMSSSMYGSSNNNNYADNFDYMFDSMDINKNGQQRVKIALPNPPMPPRPPRPMKAPNIGNYENDPNKMPKMPRPPAPPNGFGPMDIEFQFPSYEPSVDDSFFDSDASNVYSDVTYNNNGGGYGSAGSGGSYGSNGNNGNTNGYNNYGNGTAGSCSPRSQPSVKNGVCVSESQISTRCRTLQLSMSSDCKAKEFCCFANIPGASTTTMSSGGTGSSTASGGGQSTLPGGQTTTTAPGSITTGPTPLTTQTLPTTTTISTTTTTAAGGVTPCSPLSNPVVTNGVCWNINQLQANCRGKQMSKSNQCKSNQFCCFLNVPTPAPSSSTVSVGPVTVTPPSVAPPTVAPPTVAPPTVAPPTVAPPTVAPPTMTVRPPTVAPPTVAPPTVAPPTVAPPTVAPPTVGPPTVAPPTVAPPTVAPPTVAPPTVAPPTVAPPTVGPPTVAPPAGTTTYNPSSSSIGPVTVTPTPGSGYAGGNRLQPGNRASCQPTNRPGVTGRCVQKSQLAVECRALSMTKMAAGCDAGELCCFTAPEMGGDAGGNKQALQPPPVAQPPAVVQPPIQPLQDPAPSVGPAKKQCHPNSNKAQLGECVSTSGLSRECKARAAAKSDECLAREWCCIFPEGAAPAQPPALAVQTPAPVPVQPPAGDSNQNKESIAPNPPTSGNSNVAPPSSGGDVKPPSGNDVKPGDVVSCSPNENPAVHNGICLTMRQLSVQCIEKKASVSKDCSFGRFCCYEDGVTDSGAADANKATSEVTNKVDVQLPTGSGQMVISVAHGPQATASGAAFAGSGDNKQAGQNAEQQPAVAVNVNLPSQPNQQANVNLPNQPNPQNNVNPPNEQQQVNNQPNQQNNVNPPNQQQQVNNQPNQPNNVNPPNQQQQVNNQPNQQANVNSPNQQQQPNVNLPNQQQPSVSVSINPSQNAQPSVSVNVNPPAPGASANGGQSNQNPVSVVVAAVQLPVKSCSPNSNPAIKDGKCMTIRELRSSCVDQKASPSMDCDMGSWCCFSDPAESNTVAAAPEPAPAPAPVPQLTQESEAPVAAAGDMQCTPNSKPDIANGLCLPTRDLRVRCKNQRVSKSPQCKMGHWCCFVDTTTPGGLQVNELGRAFNEGGEPSRAINAL